jgi:molecular chaperone GrpE
VSDASKHHRESPAEPPAPEEPSAKRTGGGGPGEPGGSPGAPRYAGNREVPPTQSGLTKAELQSELDGLKARLEEAEAKRDEYLDDLQRVAADFDNYRKRAARDQQSLAARAHERLVKELLPVLDDLERALDAAAKHAETELEEGVQLVHRELSAALAKEGLSEIDTNGRFDPHVHEALLSQPSEADEGSVIQVLQKGYRLGEHVLRPARVVVAAPPEGRGGDDR